MFYQTSRHCDTPSSLTSASMSSQPVRDSGICKEEVSEVWAHHSAFRIYPPGSNPLYDHDKANHVFKSSQAPTQHTCLCEMHAAGNYCRCLRCHWHMFGKLVVPHTNTQQYFTLPEVDVRRMGSVHIVMCLIAASYTVSTVSQAPKLALPLWKSQDVSDSTGHQSATIFIASGVFVAFLTAIEDALSIRAGRAAELCLSIKVADRAVIRSGSSRAGLIGAALVDGVTTSILHAATMIATGAAEFASSAITAIVPQRMLRVLAAQHIWAAPVLPRIIREAATVLVASAAEAGSS